MSEQRGIMEMAWSIFINFIKFGPLFYFGMLLVYWEHGTHLQSHLFGCNLEKYSVLKPKLYPLHLRHESIPIPIIFIYLINDETLLIEANWREHLLCVLQIFVSIGSLFNYTQNLLPIEKSVWHIRSDKKNSLMIDLIKLQYDANYSLNVIRTSLLTNSWCRERSR